VRLRLLLALTPVLPTACIVYTPDLVEGPASSAASSSTESAASAGGAGGAGGAGAASSSAGTPVTSSSVASSGSGGDPCPRGGCACVDGIKGGDETDVDCGGSCPKCTPGEDCKLDADCDSDVCDGTCLPPTCKDTVENGGETDVDCGGSCEARCADGKGCVLGKDCVSGVCKGGVCQKPICGDGVLNGGEACDDGGTVAFDACSSTCALPVEHLLLSEVVTGPTASEFVEIYNPTSQTVDLSTYYLADFPTYYLVTSTVQTTQHDFVVSFPPGAKLGPGKFAVVSLRSATEFKNAFGTFPTFDFSADDANAPTMTGELGAKYGLTGEGEMVVLFRWDGQSQTVDDVDYVTWGLAPDKVDKTGVAGYAPDTAKAEQASAPSVASGKSLHRCPISEDGEKKSGGNGITGHDETSESCLASWTDIPKPTPGVGPGDGVCP